jgi:transcriptional regulator with XRE-family HTH domain
MHQPAIARLEAGDHNPTVETLMHLAQGLGIDFHIDVTSTRVDVRLSA